MNLSMRECSMEKHSAGGNHCGRLEGHRENFGSVISVLRRPPVQKGRKTSLTFTHDSHSAATRSFEFVEGNSWT